MMAARSEPAASRTAWTSSICSSSEAGVSRRSDIPEPRRSKMISREKVASRAKNAATVGWSQRCSIAEIDCGT